MCELSRELEMLWDLQRNKVENEKPEGSTECFNTSKVKDFVSLEQNVSHIHNELEVHSKMKNSSDNELWPLLGEVSSETGIFTHLAEKVKKTLSRLDEEQNIGELLEDQYTTIITGEHSVPFCSYLLATIKRGNDVQEVTVNPGGLSNADGLHAYINASILDQEISHPFILVLLNCSERQITMLLESGFAGKMTQLYPNILQTIFVSPRVNLGSPEALQQYGEIINVPKPFMSITEGNTDEGSNCIETYNCDDKIVLTNKVSMQRDEQSKEIEGGDIMNHTTVGSISLLDEKTRPQMVTKSDDCIIQLALIDNDRSDLVVPVSQLEGQILSDSSLGDLTFCGSRFCARICKGIWHSFSQLVTQCGDCCFY